MKIETLKFVADNSGGTLLRADLDLENLQTMDRSRQHDLPVAYIVRTEDLSPLRKLKDQILDRGIKHKAKGLSNFLLRKNKIPIINGNYGHAGQLKRSVRTLLENALRIGERNLYVIGADEEIFGSLWEEAGFPLNEQRLAKRGRISKSFPVRSDLLPEGHTSSQLILEMMGRCDEPPELTRKYVGDSLEVQLVRQLLLRAARVDDTVLLLGDTGTGKELVARAIHDYSKRSHGKFIPVNCGAIPRELLESELFGHERGSFTGALQKRKGQWEEADKGTLFLDEIGDLYPEHQVKILHSLQDGRIRSIGAEKEIKVDVRVIAATNRDLYSMVQAKAFREDLYYRLREFLIRTPALRNHPEDIPTLSTLFWRRITGDEKSGLPKEILEELQSYGWPGNVRELKMVLNHLRSLFGISNLRVDHLRAVFLLQGQIIQEGPTPSSPQKIGLRQVECLDHLRKTEEILRASEVALQPFLKGHGIERETIISVQNLVQLRLNELEVLCRHPLLFYDEATFSGVYQFKGKLAYFHDLLQKSTKEAMHYWKKEVARGFKETLGNISGEIKTLLSSGP